MDPDQALADARQALERMGRSRTVAEHIEQADVLATSFSALDAWLKARGYLPAAWESTTRIKRT